MGYCNRHHRYVSVSHSEKRWVRRLRRRAEKRAVRSEHTRTAYRATRRGWWYA